jgi:hypothetical protein
MGRKFPSSPGGEACLTTIGLAFILWDIKYPLSMILFSIFKGNNQQVVFIDYLCQYVERLGGEGVKIPSTYC